MPHPWCEPDPADPASSLLHVKAVPGARQDAVAGPLGERLKVRVAAPPEDGRANKAILRLLADRLGVKPAAVTLIRGAAHPEKTISVHGLAAAEVAARLAG